MKFYGNPQSVSVVMAHPYVSVMGFISIATDDCRACFVSVCETLVGSLTSNVSYLAATLIKC